MEWRCRQCGKLLGVVENERLHIRISRGREYFVNFPATGSCPRCHTLNELHPPANTK